VILQRFKDGKLADARVFKKADGLTWLDSAGRTFTLSWSELKDWVGVRAQAGRIARRASRARTASGRRSNPPRPRLDLKIIRSQDLTQSLFPPPRGRGNVALYATLD
jgi:hypothetical protein